MIIEEARARLAAALEAARAGRLDAAPGEARMLAAEFPEDLAMQHGAGVVRQLSGDHSGALDQFARALAVQPNFHFAEMELGTSHLALGQVDEAVSWFLKAARSAPTYVPAWREAGRVLVSLGRLSEALQVLAAGQAANPASAELADDLAGLLIFHDRRAEACAAFGPVIAAGTMRPADWQRYVTLLSELARYPEVLAHAPRLEVGDDPASTYQAAVLGGHAVLALRHNRPARVAAAALREASARYLDTQALLAELRGAIRDHRPLSFVRVGDGEGRFLGHADPALRTVLSPAQADALGDVAFRNWFGTPVAAADPADLIRLQAAAIAALERADILGVTSATRLASDHAHFGYLAQLEPLIARVAAGRVRMKLTDALAHIALHEVSPFYAALLTGQDFIGVISPHPGLAARLARRCNIGHAQEYLVPGESRLPEESQGRQGAPHMPDRYDELCNYLHVPRPGAVFLVAAGLAGKIYCDAIRQRGGIAIDAGSVVDAWMGLRTRPGQYEPAIRWALPA